MNGTNIRPIVILFRGFFRREITVRAISIGVSIEGGTFYYWRNNTANVVKRMNSSEYKNKWVHFAICRSSGITKVYKNGVSIFTLADTYNYLNDKNLLVSNESNLSTPAAFGGYLYYFHYIKGVAKYTSNFTVSTSIPPVLSETVLLLTASGASGTLGNTITNTTGTFEISPESAPEPEPEPEPAPVISNSILPIYSDNSRVYYKPNSLPSGGIGGVRNYRKKARRT